MKTDPLIARLVALLENAPRVPLLRERVRVDKVEVLKLVDSIASDGPDGARPGLIVEVESVREAVLRAYPIPFTDQVRLSVEQAATLAAQLRSYTEG